MDFSQFPLSNRYYGGTERKVGVLVMLKARYELILLASYEKLMEGR